MIPDTAPEVGSTWLHDRETRMTARKVELVSTMPSHEVVGYKMPHHPEMLERLQITWCKLSEWLAWAANARRIDAQH